MPEHWPISWDQYRVTWGVKDGRAETITIAVRTSDLSALPSIEPSSESGLAGHIKIGHQPYHHEAESLLRTASGLLGFFTEVDIDFDRPTIEWEAETDEEREKLKMLSFKSESGSWGDPPPIPFDLITRCFLSASAASDKEIPLRFIAKGRREMRAERYIDAFYSYFFFETLFAPGLSNPRQVSAKFKATPEIVGAMEKARRYALPEKGRVRGLAQLLALSDEQLIDHLVKTRGRLHHHAMPSPKGSWHPEKHEEFEAEVAVLSRLAFVVSQRKACQYCLLMASPSGCWKERSRRKRNVCTLSKPKEVATAMASTGFLPFTSPFQVAHHPMRRLQRSRKD